MANRLTLSFTSNCLRGAVARLAIVLASPKTPSSRTNTEENGSRRAKRNFPLESGLSFSIVSITVTRRLHRGLFDVLVPLTIHVCRSKRLKVGGCIYRYRALPGALRFSANSAARSRLGSPLPHKSPLLPFASPMHYCCGCWDTCRIWKWMPGNTGIPYITSKSRSRGCFPDAARATGCFPLAPVHPRSLNFCVSMNFS